MPDFKTIADFRKDNGPGIKNTCQMFIQLCRKLNMFEDAVVAVDGSKFKAVNSKEKNHTKITVKRRIEIAEKHIERYLASLDDADRGETSETTESIVSKIKRLKSHLGELKSIEVKINTGPNNQVSLTDPDARAIKSNGILIISRKMIA